MQNSLTNVPYPMTIIYSDLEPLSKYSPVSYTFFLLLEFLMKIQFIAQMVEHCSANAKAMCVQDPNFFSGLLAKKLNYNYHCYDHIFILKKDLKNWLTKAPNNS